MDYISISIYRSIDRSIYLSIYLYDDYYYIYDHIYIWLYICDYIYMWLYIYVIIYIYIWLLYMYISVYCIFIYTNIAYKPNKQCLGCTPSSGQNPGPAIGRPSFQCWSPCVGNPLLMGMVTIDKWKIMALCDISWDLLDISLTGAKRREWKGKTVAGRIITSDYGSFPKIPCV
jgi:hypothetical protein